MRGVRLEAEVIIVAGFAPYLKNLEQVIFKSDLEIFDRLPCAISGAAAALTPQQKELGVALLDIGAGTTSLSVYQEGDLLHLAVLPVGSGNITNDIAIGLRIDVEVAERIKIERGSCAFKGTDKKDCAHNEADPEFSHVSDSPLLFSEQWSRSANNEIDASAGHRPRTGTKSRGGSCRC